MPTTRPSGQFNTASPARVVAFSAKTMTQAHAALHPPSFRNIVDTSNAQPQLRSALFNNYPCIGK